MILATIRNSAVKHIYEPKYICDPIYVKLAPIVMKMLSHGFFSGHCLLWPWPLTFWPENLISTYMNPNTSVTEIGWNFLHSFLEIWCSQVCGMQRLTYSLTDGQTRKEYASGTEAFQWRRHKIAQDWPIISMTILRLLNSFTTRFQLTMPGYIMSYNWNKIRPSARSLYRRLTLGVTPRLFIQLRYAASSKQNTL